MKGKYHLAGLFNGGSSLFTANPRGWIGKTVCIELKPEDYVDIEMIYLEAVRKQVSFMNVTLVKDVQILGTCTCN